MVKFVYEYAEGKFLSVYNRQHYEGYYGGIQEEKRYSDVTFLPTELPTELPS